MATVYGQVPAVVDIVIKHPISGRVDNEPSDERVDSWATLIKFLSVLKTTVAKLDVFDITEFRKLADLPPLAYFAIEDRILKPIVEAAAKEDSPVPTPFLHSGGIEHVRALYTASTNTTDPRAAQVNGTAHATEG